MMDSHKSYVMKGQTHGQAGQHRNVLFQFEHTPCGEGLNCLGNQNVDQADLVLIGELLKCLVFLSKLTSPERDFKNKY